MTLNHAPVVGRSAWKGCDLIQDDSWIYQLSPAVLTELDAALKRVKARNIPLFEIRREDFPLPSLVRDVPALLDELENGRGFFVIRGLPVESYCLDDVRILYWGLSSYFGNAVSQNASGHLFTDVHDAGVRGYGGSAVRGYLTNSLMRFHVDFADVVALLCVRKAKEGGHSSIASSLAIYNEIVEHHPDLLDVYLRGFYFDRKNEQRPGVSPVSEQRVPVFSAAGGKLSIFFNRDYSLAAARRMGQPLSDREMAALDLFDSIANREDFRLNMALLPGDIQFANNYAIVHSRTDFVDYEEPERKRLMVRLWLAMRQGRELVPAVANLYGPGSARQGVPPVTEIAAAG